MLIGAAGPAILAGFLDGQRARKRALEQQAREAQQLQLAIFARPGHRRPCPGKRLEDIVFPPTELT